MRPAAPLPLALTLLIVASLRLGAAPALATPPGDLDLSFGGSGRVTTDFLGNDRARAVVVQADGKIVAGATRAIAGNIGFALARYETDGTPDLAFGTNGHVTTDFGATDDIVQALLLQPDGKIVALGTDGFQVLLARYQPDGSLDASFGNGGRVTTGPRNSAADIVRQSDGKLVVAGSRNGPSTSEYDFLLVRYQADGTLDATFGSGGIVTTNFPDDRQDAARAVALQPDGKLLAAGYAVNLSHGTDLALARYNADGSLDASFGSGGLVRSQFGTFDELFDVAVQSDGKIVAAGETGLNGSLLRYLPDGSLDATFGSGGRVQLDVDGFVTSMLIDPAGAFVLGTETVNPPTELARARADGSLDTSFGVGGRVSLALYAALGTFERNVAVALQPDGRIVVAGTPPTGTDFEVARYAGGHVLTCPPMPAVGCKVPIGSGRSALQIEHRHGKRKLSWQWRHGDAVTAANVGNPTASDDYALCLYDESGPSTLADEMLAPSAGVCTGSPCWRAKNGGKFTYADEEGTPLGFTALELKPGDIGKGNVRARGAGDNLSLRALPSALPLRVQLQSTTGACWEAVFSAAGMKRNDSERFQGKSD